MNVQTTIQADRQELLRQAREEAYSAPIDKFHPGAPIFGSMCQRFTKRLAVLTGAVECCVNRRILRCCLKR